MLLFFLVVILFTICCEKEHPTAPINADEYTTVKLYDYNYTSNKYFFIDEVYHKNYEEYLERDRKLTHGYSNSNIIRYLDVYASAWHSGMSEERWSGWAVIDPNNLDTSYTSIENVKRYWYKLGINDYTVDANLGILKLNKQIHDSTMLAVAYSDISNNIVGSLSSGSELPNPLILKLLKIEYQTDPIMAWDLMLRNVYEFNNIYERYPEISTIRIFYNDVASLPRDYLETSVGPKTYLEIFGLDRCGTQGSSDPDGIIDTQTYFFQFNEDGVIIEFPSLQPFADTTNTLLPSDKYVKSIYNTCSKSTMMMDTKYYGMSQIKGAKLS